MSLEELTSWLYGRTAGGIKWGLETTRALLAGGGDPHRRFRSLHIGGTNGKGSVAALCASALRRRDAGPVGLYTSPHLVSFLERVQIDGEPVGEEQLLAAARRLEPLIVETGASFFEATTAMAFLCFAEAGVEMAVVEVGLGGRLDATNVLDPLVTAVTNVALDHAEELGSTLSRVAVEKAGIFKPGVPAITAAEDPEVVAVLRERAEAVGAPFRLLEEVAGVEEVESGREGTRFVLRSSHWGRREVALPLAGKYQARNAALAAEALALLPEDDRPAWEHIETGFARVRWRGRLQLEQLRGTTWLFDVAHNEHGAAALADALASLELPRPVVLVAGILADKQWRAMLPPLLRQVDHAILTIPDSAPAGRRWDPGAAAAVMHEEMGVSARVVPELAAALARASTLAPHGTVLVTGSIHTVGDALQHLGLAGL